MVLARSRRATICCLGNRFSRRRSYSPAGRRRCAAELRNAAHGLSRADDRAAQVRPAAVPLMPTIVHRTGLPASACGRSEPAMTVTTKVSRLIKAPSDAVYRACTDLGSIVRWRVPESMTGKVDSVDGATYRMSLTYPRRPRRYVRAAPSSSAVPNEKIVERIRFDAADRAGEMIMTTTLRAVEGGTEVSIRYDGLPGSIRPEDNDEGTRQALGKVATLRRLEGARRALIISRWRQPSCRADRRRRLQPPARS